ncbi:MAG: O-antigen ligase family protein [Planctomycetaceae bacterium]
MSASLVLWLSLFAVLALLAFRRPAWGVALYMLTFFACPPFWWWGNSIETLRWNFYGGLILLGAVLLSSLIRPNTAPLTKGGKWVVGLSLVMLVNATLVHLLLANSLRISSIGYLLMAKFMLLFLLMVASIRSRADLRIMILSIVVGAGYIGYEATINGRGKLNGNRLEGIGAPNAAGANQLASLIVTVLPLTGALLLAGTRLDRIVAVAAAPLILNVALLCNSRGAFLAAIASGVALLSLSPSKVRKQAIKVLALGVVAVWLMLGDSRIVDRFMTSFVDAEERDSSATSRLLYWRAGMNMIQDHPFGTGGHGFKRVYGPRYIAELGPQFEIRSVHNGFINETCEWGIQGLAIRLAFVAVTAALLYSTCRHAIRTGRNDVALTCATLIAALVAFLGSCIFGDRLDAEWGFWISALAVGFARVAAAEDAETADDAHSLLEDAEHDDFRISDDMRCVA